MRPPTNMQRLSRDPPRLLARQKRNHARDIIRHAHPAERTPRRDAGVDLVPGQVVGPAALDVLARVLEVHVALDAARGDAVDGDVLGAQVPGQTLDEAGHGGFGGGVDCVSRDALSLVLVRWG